MTGRVIALWLDGFDMALADAYGLPVLASLHERGAVATLDNGTAHLTGLTGEHLSTGLDPRAASRFSAVRFDPKTYGCVQEGTRHAPVFGDVRTVVFDMAYFDLDRADDNVVGISDWGVHDPGGRAQARPESLRDELETRFGPYPARKWIYGVPWASSRACSKMGSTLASAVDIRSRIARWLLGERVTDWDLALIGFSESHSASEGLFHGSGPNHPWSNLASAPHAAVGLRSVYSAIDRAVGEIIDAFPNDTVVVFSMHGMGPNNSDVPSMALLGELLVRWAGLELESERPFPCDAHGIPILPPRRPWTPAVFDSLMGQRPNRARRVIRTLRRRVRLKLHTLTNPTAQSPSGTSATDGGSLSWMPLMRHRSRWSHMRAFALPSFYDGRIRINLVGREARGLVGIDDYEATLDEVESLLRSCTEPRTGASIVTSIVRVEGDPLSRTDDDADMIVHWEPNVLGITHEKFGTIGPLPPRRTGGHASPIGRCIIVGKNVTPGDLGVRSSFDVVPTIFGLVGAAPDRAVSGRSLVDSAR